MGHFWLRRLYAYSFFKKWLLRWASSHSFAWFVGLYERSPLSARAVPSFVRRFGIILSDFQVPHGGFKSFDAFFTRRLRDGVRPIAKTDLVMPCDGRYRFFPRSDLLSRLDVKNEKLSLSALLGPADDPCFHGGALVFARLAPVDYHRVHMPMDATHIESWEIPGKLYSVNPLATGRHPTIFQKNTRHVHLFESKGMRFLIVVVGATCVGSIVYIDSKRKVWKKGEEFSYFRFGGSLVILVFEKGHIQLDADLLENAAAGYETLGRVGDSFAMHIGH